MRTLKTPNELYDLISQMRGGAKVSVGYVSTAGLPKTTKNVNWDNVRQNKDNFPSDFYDSMQTLEPLGGKGKFANIGINGIVKVSQFTTNWQTTQNFAKNRQNLEQAREDWLTDHGASQEDIDARRREATYNTVDYGDNGIKIEKNTNKTTVFLNPVTNTHASYSYYIIDANGDASRPISKEGAEMLIAKKSNEPELIKVLDNVENSEDVKAEYREWCKAMKYLYRKYSLDNVLYIVGKVDGEPFFFYNEALTSQVSSQDKNLVINPQAFLKIARGKAEKSLADFDEWSRGLQGLPESRKYGKKVVKENIVKLDENKLRKIVSEAIYEYLEML